ncbi:MAG: DDE-type integrase/transposase/recombinase [Gammaproteobacteria bacterium]|nr:DDE-type integrase/transposase/recombinase [Gammaproteobacteria bacterium]MBU2059922.1 DDE-type integrase/transposase/recombinase [Gammaproteobacteria bacterium]MBU2175823.1 DDE-type integrase/transposase/recombinase [Gammaproteobacteria bacterium]MBU2247646.1 DDE-type integrase/transposase/recombinase [Gammaproteobacteria bacterium]MBU2392070.1 DDE-type integrase/transposase/recombinase [Gammaproteobacteria bacterium]
MRDKASVTLVRAICSAIELYGIPRLIRTDNEAVFTSRTFRWALKFLGIKHQCTDLGCPWHKIAFPILNIEAQRRWPGG